jgi:hypothetical protein
MTEKVGNRKRSNGNAAIFGGSSRRGEGAYIAVASVNGPGGQEYASVGVENNGYYTADQRLRSGRGQGAVEINDPKLTFDGDTIHIESPSGDTSITITAQTGNPATNLYKED